jgi:glycosyltransferase involved in cell wall biosynthesis
LRIVHLNANLLAGGASRAAWRLHQALLASGADSSFFVQRAERSDPVARVYHPETGALSRLLRFARRERLAAAKRIYANTRPPEADHFRDDRVEFASEPLKQVPAADIYHLHWIAGFLDYRRILPGLAARVPLIWTLHDLNPFTGGCHFDGNCGRFAAGCGQCPQLGSQREEDLSRDIWNRKRSAFGRISPAKLRFVAPSQWMAQQVVQAPLLRQFDVSVVPNSVESALFRPRPEARMLRRAFGIDEGAFVALFAADYAEAPRKGFACLDAALATCGGSAVHLVSIGKGAVRSRSGLPHLHLGSIENDDLLASLYAMADCFLLPSLEDNLPNTALEAQSCGLPVVAFRIGGIPEVVLDGETGLLAAVGDTASFGRAVRVLAQDALLRRSLGSAARRHAVARFSPAGQAAAYLDLYQDALECASIPSSSIQARSASGPAPEPSLMS